MEQQLAKVSDIAIEFTISLKFKTRQIGPLVGLKATCSERYVVEFSSASVPQKAL